MIAPPKESIASKPKKPTGKQPFSATRLVVWGCVGLLAAAVAVWAVRWYGGEIASPQTDKQEKPKKPAAPKPAPKPELVEKPAAPVEVKPVSPPKPLPPGNVMTARTAKAGRVMTLMDGTVVTNSAERPFKRDLEHSLWVALRPGNMGAGLITTLQRRHSQEEIIAMLKEKVVPEPGDSEGLVRIKREVQELKDRMLQALDTGRSLDSIFDEIRAQGVMESKVKAETMRLRAEAIRTGDPEQVREAVRKANEYRAKNGLEPMEVPDQFKEPPRADGEEPPEAASTEFDETGGNEK